MATFSILIQKHQKRLDGKYPVSIRLTFKRKKVYLKTEYYVTDKQIDSEYNLKDKFLLRTLRLKIEQYENVILQKIGNRLSYYTVKELKEYLIHTENLATDDTIDFVAFSLTHIDRIRKNQKSRSGVLSRTLNSFIDFFGRNKISISEITNKVLKEYEFYLLNPRSIVRKNQYGKDITYDKPPCKASGVYDYIGNIRTLFNAAKEEYNDEDKGDIRITHDPFKKYVMIKRKQPKKRNLDAEIIRKIINMPQVTLNGTNGINRAEQARDIFILSYLLIGINTVDLYRCDNYSKGRITYSRSKTKNIREDDAIISIKVEPEAIPYLEKYKDKTGKRVFCFYQRYSTIENFNRAINLGLNQISEQLELDIKLTSYWVRHSWATIARNDLNIGKDDINEALNHADIQFKVTDMYIAKSWKNIDKINRDMIDFIYGVVRPLPQDKTTNYLIAKNLLVFNVN